MGLPEALDLMPSLLLTHTLFLDAKWGRGHAPVSQVWREDPTTSNNLHEPCPCVRESGNFLT